MPIHDLSLTVTIDRATRGVARQRLGVGVPVARGGDVVIMRGRSRADGGSEHGAAAVEMALLLPLLILLLGGVIDFGFLFNAQISATHAAREGVRVEAIGTGDAAQTAQDAFFAPAATPLGAQVVRSCPNGDGALLRMRASYDFFFLPFGQRTLTGEAVMRCNG
jgi:hypothetical protein